MKPVNQQNIFDIFVDFYGDEEIEPLQVQGDEADVSTSMPRIVIERTQKQNVSKCRSNLCVISKFRILNLVKNRDFGNNRNPANIKTGVVQIKKVYFLQRFCNKFIDIYYLLIYQKELFNNAIKLLA